MAGRYDFMIKQGSTFSMAISWTEGDSEVDLVNYTGRMQIRYGTHNGAIAADLTTENGGIRVNSGIGQVIVFLSAEQTAKIDNKPCVYDLEMVEDDYVIRLLEGKVRVSPEVTK